MRKPLFLSIEISEEVANCTIKQVIGLNMLKFFRK